MTWASPMHSVLSGCDMLGLSPFSQQLPPTFLGTKSTSLLLIASELQAVLAGSKGSVCCCLLGWPTPGVFSRLSACDLSVRTRAPMSLDFVSLGLAKTPSS